MRKIFLILTIVCLLVTLTIVNAIPVSAGTLIITPPVGGPEDPEEPPDPQDPGQDPDPVMTTIVVAIPDRAGEDLSGVAEKNTILEYILDQQIPEPEPPGPQDPPVPHP